MKLKLAVCIASLFSASAFAQPFFIDINDDRGNNTNPTANGPTSTGWLDELQFIYNSWSTIFDADNNGIDAGDTITSTGGILGSGFNMSLIGDNVFSSLLPTQAGGGPSRNGFGDTWGMTFGFNDLVGIVTDPDPTDFKFQLTGGTISLYYYEEADLLGCAVITDCVTRMFDMQVTSGGSIPSSLIINGYLNNFNNVDTVNGVSAGSLFYTDHGGVDSFDNIYNDLVSGGLPFSLNMRVDQNANDFPGVQSYNLLTQTFTLNQARHDGSASFSIPEPASLAILGLGLLGLGVSSRRKAKN